MEKECSKCGWTSSVWTNDLYKLDDEIYCAECLIDKLDLEINTTTNYLIDCTYLGSDDNYSELMDNICEHFEIEKIREA